MVFKSFRIRFLLRLFLLVITTFTGALCFYFYGFYYTSFILLFLFVFQVADLFRFADRTHKDLNQFLLSLKHHDYSNRYTPRNELSLHELRETYNLITTEFQRLRAEKEFQHLFLQQILENLSVGILCINSSEEILLYNASAKILIGPEHLPALTYINKIQPDLYRSLKRAGSGMSEIVKFSKDGEPYEISIRSFEFKLGDEHFCLFTLNNIKNELDLQEAESWQKLIRVITHEIMNSITPITSLSSTLNETIAENEQLSSEDILDIENGLKVIQKRSLSLISFVETYRNLARLPAPEIAPFRIEDLLGRIHALFSEELLRKKIQLTIIVHQKNLEILADINQMEQVLINLINNAADALENTNAGCITIEAGMNKKQVFIRISDNGKGMEQETLEKVFIPFYTTKESGSGIGLALSRQILYNNKASISVKSTPEKGTQFLIGF